MPKAEVMTDAQVEEEIARLRESEYVLLARQNERIRNRRRQYLYTLRALEKKGRALAEQGLTREKLLALAAEAEDVE